MQQQHLIRGFEGLLARVMYVFDDALVFVAAPTRVTIAEASRLAAVNLKGVHAPSFTGEGLFGAGAKLYLKKRKFSHIAEFSRQFGDAGFSDPRVTSTLVATEVDGARRVLLEAIDAVSFRFRTRFLVPHIVVRFAISDAAPIEFWMRYRSQKVQEVHRTLATVLGARVGALNPP